MIKIKQISKDGIELVTDVARENVTENLKDYFAHELSKVTFLVAGKTGLVLGTYDLVNSTFSLNHISKGLIQESPFPQEKEKVLISLEMSVTKLLKDITEITFEQ